jgi:NhaP-type Na+/H+ or K+/H+ antiporter
MLDVCLIAAVVFAYSLFSRRVEGSVLTAPMVFVGAGLLLGPGTTGLLQVSVSNHDLLTVGEITLVFVLFTDTARIDRTVLSGNRALPFRLLAVGLPLTMVAGALIGARVVPGLTVWEAAIAATVLAPTDLSLAEPVLATEGVPARIRQALDVEAGLNHGLSVLCLTITLSLAEGEETAHSVDHWIGFAVKQIGLGVLIGLAIGLVGSWLVRQASNAGWMSDTFKQYGLLALALTVWILADEVGGNGFIATFIAGLVTGTVVEDAGKHLVAFAAEAGQLLSLGVLVLFGGIATKVLGSLTWSVVFYAVLSLTLIRMVPVAIALVGTRLRPSSVLFLSWFGPRGLTSIVLVLLVIEEAQGLPGRDTIVLLVVATVLLSVFAHGLTAAPLSERYARRATALPPDAPEWHEVAAIPTRTGWSARARASRAPVQ